MENIDLKMMWHEAHFKNQLNISDKANLHEIISMNHCKTISHVLFEVKARIVVHSFALIILIGLMIYALVYLGLDLSINSIIPLSLTGIFLLFRTITEIINLLILNKSTNNLSVKASMLFFRKRLKRIKIIEFLSALILLYTLAIWITFGYINEIGGVRNLFGADAIQPVLLIFILILLLIPWIIKYNYTRRYRKIYSELDDPIERLNNEY